MTKWFSWTLQRGDFEQLPSFFWSQGVITVKLPHEVYKLHLKRQKQYCWLTDIHNLPMLKCFSCMKRSLDISDTLKQSLSLAEDWLTHQSPLDRGCPDLRKFEAPKNRFAITITFGGGVRSKSITPYLKKTEWIWHGILFWYTLKWYYLRPSACLHTTYMF